MAYNPNLYMPNSYNYGFQQQNMQPMPYNSGYQQMNMQPINGLVSVTGMEGARAYQLPPNSKMPLFDENDDVLYLKTTDSAGYPKIKAFTFEPMQNKSAGYQQDFVTRDEYNELLDRVSAIENAPRSRRRSQDAE